MGQLMTKVKIQITEENTKFMKEKDLSYAKTINVMLDILRLSDINNKNIEDLRVLIQKGKNTHELLYRLL